MASETRNVLDPFWEQAGRAEFITNSDALKDTERSLKDAADRVHSLLVRYEFIKKLAKVHRGKPKINDKFKGDLADQRWRFGELSTNKDEGPVLLEDGTKAKQVIMVFKTKGIRPTHNMRFECREMVSIVVGNRSHRILDDPPSCCIVGWTLTCRTAQPGQKSVTVKSGGVLRNELEIDVKGTLREAEWRCRIFFVDKREYNFPRLYRK
jgi:hypothetical protein